MNWDEVRGSWNQFKGKILEYFGRLSDEDVVLIAGRREALVARVEAAWGLSRAAAEKQVMEFEKLLEEWRPAAELEAR